MLLRGDEESIDINWCEITIRNEQSEVIYINAFVTDHLITEENCVDIVTAGRTRWKMENEHNNTLKTKGYHLEHRKENLSEFLFTLNIIAFLFHSVLHLHDRHYQAIRNELGSRKTFF